MADGLARESPTRSRVGDAPGGEAFPGLRLFTLPAVLGTVLRGLG